MFQSLPCSFFRFARPVGFVYACGPRRRGCIGQVAGLAAWASLAVLLSTASPADAQPLETQDPNLTATIYVHGFDASGADQQGVYGDDVHDPLLDRLANLVGLPTINQNGGEFLPNVVAATTYYGDTPPPYYNADDIADIDRVTQQWGGGIPRYATIVAKYARFVMERSGARQVNFVSASMGSFVTRWLIEKDVEGLASEGKIARWITLEGVVAGNWAASNDGLIELWDLFGTPPIDVAQMHYNWFEQNVHSPRTEADSAYYGDILIGQIGSTDDTGNGGALTTYMFLVGDYQPNDGVQGLYDTYFHNVTDQSRFLGRWPTLSYFYVDHLGIADDRGAWAAVASFMTQRRRVKITLTRAQVTDIHEPDNWYWDWTPGEIIFENRVFSPLAESRWGYTEPISQQNRDGVNTPIYEYDASGDRRTVNHVVFDAVVMDDETDLTLELWAEELDWHVRYDVLEPLQNDWDDLGGTTITVPVTEPGTYHFEAPDFNGDLRVEVFNYPFHPLGCDDGGFGEFISKAKCSNRRGKNLLKVVVQGGRRDAAFTVTLDTGAVADGTFNRRGKGKVRFRGSDTGSGPGSATAIFECGNADTKSYDCPN